MLRRMRGGGAALHQRLQAMCALSVSAKSSEMGSSRVRSGCTVSITASKGLAAGHRRESRARYSGEG